jgi:hypothetical protein
MTQHMLTIDPDFPGHQIPAVGDIMLMIGLPDSSAAACEQTYGRRLKGFCETVAIGHQFGRNTLLIATELIEEAAQTFQYEFERKQHSEKMRQRAAELLIAMTPREYHNHPHLRQARNFLREAA